MHRCEAPFGSGRRYLFVLDRLRAPVRVPLLSVLVGLITIVGLITMLPSENPTALGLPSKLKVSRTARSSRRSKRTGGDDDADGVDAVMVKDTEGRTIIPLPAGARCDTCPFQDCDEDPSIKQLPEVKVHCLRTPMHNSNPLISHIVVFNKRYPALLSSCPLRHDLIE